ncbi:hypothetical protein KQX54_012538 [Cotesia glomerata]|uniref:Uncharacterized protein n=1 Tax=Cotesia glomerata TaxID=32391 RepID=A0AAV7I2Q1_COTGL|nr:hypothetical protein KQX54_012538 [Cotesia glomerata]
MVVIFNIFIRTNSEECLETEQASVPEWVLEIENQCKPAVVRDLILNGREYEDIKHLAVGDLRENLTKKEALRANYSSGKSKSGAPFIIQVRPLENHNCVFYPT